MLLTVLVGCGVTGFFLIIYLLKRGYDKKVGQLENEVTLFKKEKQYFSEAILVLSGDFEIAYANRTAMNLFHLDEQYQPIVPEKVIQLKVDTEYSEEFFTALIKQIKKHEGSFHLRNVLLVMDGKMSQINIYIDKNGYDIDNTISCVIDLHPVTLPEMTQSVEERGSIDFLTGLPSQFSALSEMNRLVIEAQKQYRSFAVLLMGIDHFSDLQSALGLGYTNRILKNIGHYFLNERKDQFAIYRMEGDKFLIIVEQTGEEHEVVKLAQELMVSIDSTYKGNVDIRLSTSVGVALYPKDGSHATMLIDNAYVALHQAQSQGESSIALSQSEYQATHLNEVKMNEDIRKGLKNNEFLLHYQPIFHLDAETMVGAEALIRWKHPEYGLLSAEKFLDIAQKTGLIIDLGEYVFGAAILQSARCHAKMGREFPITVNLSLKEMQVTALLPRLEMLFHKYKIAKSSINLDLTENDVVANIEKSLKDLKLLKEFGISLSLDHFGAGCSTLKYFGKLPIDMIKIDRSLIFDIALNTNHQKIVQSIIQLAHQFGYKVIAEGVETSKEASILASLKCDYAQGYLYSRPMPSMDFEALIQ